MDYIFKTDFLDFQSKNKNKNIQYYHWAEKKRVDKQKNEYEQFRKMWFEIDQQQQKEKHKSNARSQKIPQKKTVSLRPQELYNKHMQWRHQVDQKLQRKREEKRYEQDRATELVMVHESKGPKLIRQQSHKGPIKAWQQRFNNYIRARSGEDYNQSTQNFAPKIDKNSRRITKQMLGKVQDRLLQYGEKLKEKKVQMETIYEEQLHCRRNFGNINQSIESSQISDVYWRLYKDGERLNQKRNEKKIEYTFTPQINQYSNEIASRLTQKRTPLYQSKMPNQKTQVLHKASRKEKKSTQKGFNDFLKRNQALLSKIENNRIKQMQMLREKQNKQINECTFTPVLNPKSLKIFANNITLQTNSQVNDKIQYLSKIQIEEYNQNEQSEQKKLVTAKSELNQLKNNSSKVHHSSQKIQRMHSDGHFVNVTDHLFIQQHDSISNLNSSKAYQINQSSINRNTTNKNKSSDESDFLATEKITPPIQNIHEQVEEDSIERQRDNEWQKQLNMMQRQIEAMMQRTNL